MQTGYYFYYSSKTVNEQGENTVCSNLIYAGLIICIAGIELLVLIGFGICCVAKARLLFWMGNN